jgi:hypothetical protein
MKSKRNRSVLLSIAVILAVSCICITLIIVSGLGVSLIWPFQITQDETPEAVSGEETATESAGDETPTESIDIETPAVGGETDEELDEGFSEDLIAAMDLIETQVIRLRGLQPTGPVVRDLISVEELEEIVVNDLFSDYTDEDVHQDVLELSTLGLLAEDFNLKEFYNLLYTEQIAGFYDNELKEMYVVQGEKFGGSEKLTYAHEYTHVLQDQVYGLDEGLGLNDEGWEEDSERCAAIQALIEGDATTTEIIWFQNYATQEDYQDYLEAYTDFKSPVFDSAPPYMAADLYFPYEYGYEFVDLLYQAGGYEAVDAAYVNLPLSTEQILHPERYPDDKPVKVELPDLTELLGGDWFMVDENVMGEWYTYLILGKAYDESFQLPEALASEAAEGWGGDAYAFYIDEATEDVVFIEDMVWDTAQDADEYFEAFIKYADLRWTSENETINGYHTWSGDQGIVVLLQEGGRTLWVIAPDREIMESLLTALT